MPTSQRDEYKRVAEHIDKAQRELTVGLDIARASGLTLISSLERVIGQVDRLRFRFSRRVSRG